MSARIRDAMLIGGVLSFVVAGFLIGLMVGFIVVGFFLLAAVYLLGPEEGEAES